MERIEYISFEEFTKLYKAASDDKELRLAMLLGFGSGLRISEIVGLRAQLSRCCKKSIIKKKEPRVTDNKKILRYSCSHCNNNLTFRDIVRSNNEWEIPPLKPEQVNIQTHQIRLDVAKGGKWRVTITPKNLTPEMLKLLPLEVPRRTIQYRFDQLCLKVLNKKMSFHILRHGFGNYQVNVLKLPLPMVQQFMGHSRLDTTGIYTKVNPDFAIQEAWKAMGG